MNRSLWYLLAGTVGGPNRVRLIRALSDHPQNASQLADRLDVDYNTVTYHLGMLAEHDVVESDGRDYGEMYYLTDEFRRNRETFERIAEQVTELPSSDPPDRQSGELRIESDADAEAGSSLDGRGDREHG